MRCLRRHRHTHCCCLLVENIQYKRKRVEKREGSPLEKVGLTLCGVLNNILPAAAGGDAAPARAPRPRRARDHAHTPIEFVIQLYNFF